MTISENLKASNATEEQIFIFMRFLLNPSQENFNAIKYLNGFEDEKIEASVVRTYWKNKPHSDFLHELKIAKSRRSILDDLTSIDPSLKSNFSFSYQFIEFHNHVLNCSNDYINSHKKYIAPLLPMVQSTGTGNLKLII